MLILSHYSVCQRSVVPAACYILIDLIKSSKGLVTQSTCGQYSLRVGQSTGIWLVFSTGRLVYRNLVSIYTGRLVYRYLVSILYGQVSLQVFGQYLYRQVNLQVYGQYLYRQVNLQVFGQYLYGQVNLKVNGEYTLGRLVYRYMVS